MLVNNYNSILKRKSSNWQPETITQKNRIEADGGVVIDLSWMNRVILNLKILGIYSNCKLLTDANFGVRKDITGAVSKLYDISGNNNDAVQTTGASQPIWSLVSGSGIVTYDGLNDFFNFPTVIVLDSSFTIRLRYFTTLPNTSTAQRSFIGSANGSQKIQKGVQANKYFFRIINGGSSDTNILLPDASLVNSLCLVRGSDNLMFVYINNNVNSLFSGVAQVGNYPISYIGKSSTSATYFWSGRIDNLLVFNSNLTESQLSTLYNLGL